MTRTYVHAYKGTPVSSFFSSKSGAFITKFNYTKSITADTELFTYPDWYPQGYKITMARADSGKTLEGMTKYMVGDHPNYTGFSFFDDTYYDGRDVQIIVTPAIQKISGVDTGVGNGGKSYQLSWNMTDIGADAFCTFNVNWSDGMPRSLEAHIVNRNNESIKTFISHKKSDSKQFNCADVIDGKFSLISISTGLFTLSKEVVSISLSGINGHTLDINISAPASEFLF